MTPTVRSLAISVPLPASPINIRRVFRCEISPKWNVNNADVRSGTGPHEKALVGPKPQYARKVTSKHILTSPRDPIWDGMTIRGIVNKEMTESSRISAVDQTGPAKI